MNPIGKALWYIESHARGELTLDEIAVASGVSKWHLSRLFNDALGRSIIHYLRARRLTAAARQLADGAPDILAVALDAGYGSHEAFTRAFRDQFGCTPESVRTRGHCDDLNLVEAITMDASNTIQLESPRLVDSKAMLIAGISARYRGTDVGGIPAQWGRFAPRIGHVPGQLGGVSYGVCFNTDDENNFDYLCGVEVADFGRLPADLDRVRIPVQRYAVFKHAGHISGIRQTFVAIFNDWLPNSGQRMADAPLFERYDESFDGRTGMGGVEIWIPMAA